MDILINVIIFLVGLGVGFVAVKFFSSSSKEQQKLTQQAAENESALEQYKKDVAEHLTSSAKLLDDMNTTCKTAMDQMAKSTALLQKATPDETVTVPFFSKEIQEELAQTVNQRKQSTAKNEEITEAPRDYSGQPSGLLSSEKQTVT